MIAHIYTEIVYDLILGMLCLGILAGLVLVIILFRLLRMPGLQLNGRGYDRD